MKRIWLLMLALTITNVAMAAKVECKSPSHGLTIDGKIANYSVAGEESTADVLLENLKMSNGFLTASINIDGQPGHMKVAAIKTKNNVYEGKLQAFKLKLYDVTCTVSK